MRMKQVADRIGKHENTVRNWSRTFAEFLSPAPAKGEHRRFDDDDLRLLGFVAKLSDQNMSMEDIRAELKRKLEAGVPFPMVPIAPSAADDAGSEATGLVPIGEVEVRLAAKDAEIAQLNARIEELRRQIGEISTRYNEREDRFFEEIGRLREEIGRLKAQVPVSPANGSGVGGSTSRR